MLPWLVKFEDKTSQGLKAKEVLEMVDHVQTVVLLSKKTKKNQVLHHPTRKNVAGKLSKFFSNPDKISPVASVQNGTVLLLGYNEALWAYYLRSHDRFRD